MDSRSKLPASAPPPPKQTSILNFLSRGQQPQSRQGLGTGNGSAATLPPAPRLQVSPTIPPPPVNRYAPPPSLSSNDTATSLPAKSPTTPPISAPQAVPPTVALTATASLTPITASHIPSIKTLNQLTLPVHYGEPFYRAILDPSPSALASGKYSRVILHHPAPSSSFASPTPVVAGAIVCRPELAPFTERAGEIIYTPVGRGNAPSGVGLEGELTLYIQSLALFSPYRSQGLMGLALDQLLRYAASNPPSPAAKVTSAYAHVWTENTEALDWYAKRGFERVGDRPVDGYYHRLNPGTAWVMRRRVRVGDLLAPAPLQISGSFNNNVVPPAKSPSPAPTADSISGIAPPRSGPPKSPLMAPNPSSGLPPPSSNASSTSLSSAPAHPGPPSRGQSFQNARPETEWNDLPADMMGSSRNGGTGSGSTSAASSRSSSAVRKKRDRAYPKAAFES